MDSTTHSISVVSPEPPSSTAVQSLPVLASSQPGDKKQITAPTLTLEDSGVPNTRQEAVETVSNPEILRFAKMLTFGVPLMAVEQKMRAEGYDPALLHSKGTSSAGSHQQRDESSSDEQEFDSSSNNE